MLKAKDYPQEKWPFVLRLMSLFQLSFPLDEDGQRELVLALLPVEELSAWTARSRRRFILLAGTGGISGVSSGPIAPA